MNRFGTIFGVEVFGESHGPEVGVLIDGCPPGIPLSPDDFETDLARRRSGSLGTTPRREHDIPRLLSGLHNGLTTGAPICISFQNGDTRSADYDGFRSIPRPGHADFTASVKYDGYADPRGSGHFSGRITVGVVAAGVIAKRILPGLEFATRILEAGGDSNIGAAVEAAAEESDSIGALVEIRVKGLPAGLGEPYFDTCEGRIAQAVFAVPGVRGIEFGDGFGAARMRGSEHNDPYVDIRGATGKNGSGGINGGITNGNELAVRIAVKPASSIGRAQETMNFSSGRMELLVIEGRHDACIALRSAVVLEASVAIALADLFLVDRARIARKSSGRTK